MDRLANIKAYCTLTMWRILMLGFTSGLILPLTSGTLSAYLWDHDIDIKTIGLFTAVALPYSWKFIWAPFVDNIDMPILSRILGKRRGWLLVMQLMLIVNIAALGFITPIDNTWGFALTVLSIGFLSATQDILIDAFRIEILDDSEQAMGATMAILGYRIGMLASSAGALYMASHYSWQITFISLSSLMVVGLIAVMFQPEPIHPTPPDTQHMHFLHWVKHAFWQPLQDFMQRRSPLLILGLVVSYKLGDAYLGVMTTPFLLEMEFTKIELATYVKSYGFFASMLGTFWGGYIVKTKGYGPALIIGLYVQMFSNLIFILQYINGHDIPTLVLTITIDNVTGGIGTAVLVGYVSHLCNREFTATQYALLSSLDSVARVTLPMTSGFIVTYIGWIDFFLFSAMLNIPALILAYIIFRQPQERKNEYYLQQRNNK